MKKILVNFLIVCVILATCGVFLTACGKSDLTARGKSDVWTMPTRISLSLPDKVHVEYVNDPIAGERLCRSIACW